MINIDNIIDPANAPITDDVLKAFESASAGQEINTNIFPPNSQFLSFNKPIVEAPTQTKPVTKVKYRQIIKSWIVDKFTTKRIRIDLTPSVCDVCAFDIAQAKHGHWDNVPEERRADVIQALVEHKKEQHPIREDLIVEHDQVPTQWLGNNNVF